MSLAVAAAVLAGLPALGGCDKTLRKEERVTKTRDGTTITEREEVKRRPDGSIVTEREKDVDRDDY